MSFRASCPRVLLWGLVVIACLGWAQDGWTQRRLDHVRLVQFIEINPLDFPKPVGLTSSSRANEFLLLEGADKLMRLNALHEPSGTVTTPEAISDPLNMAYDAKADRLLILQSDGNQLSEIPVGFDSDLRVGTPKRIEAQHFGMADPQGITVDPLSGNLYILDAVWSLIISIEPDPVLGFAQPLISEIDLRVGALDAFELRGIAFDPVTRNLFVLDPQNLRLYEVTAGGVVVSNRDVSDMGLSNPQAMVFAPSGDRTDDPSIMSLYVLNTDSTKPAGKKPSEAAGAWISELSIIQ
jgi:DNA-binding beta-propeller fold protein YncE